MSFRHIFLLVCLVLAPATQVSAQVVINEIHYHPVEDPHFDANGNPTYSDTGLPADLSSDVHEFVEIYNSGGSPVDLSGWQFSSGVTYTFPNGTSIAAGGYKVIAANPARLQTVYGISGVLGPYSGHLNNGGDSVKLKDANGNTIDSVNYSNNFPWAQSADGMGASGSFTNLSSVQYKGRSLQRVSATASSNDPANWVGVRPALGATTFADLPTPGAANIVSRAVPKPVVVAYAFFQNADEAPIIRAGNLVRVSCTFSGTTSLSAVSVEYFVDDVNSTAETRTSVVMTESPVGSGQYSAVLPGQVDRSVVRYRFKANRGDGVEVVSPRADDPAIVPVADDGTNHGREAWFAYFVTPARSSANPIYDFFISDASLTILSNNINQSPRRVTASGPTGLPRATPYVAASAPQWNGEQPSIFVTNGEVRDVRIRYHGSRYNRSVARQSYKVKFPGTEPFMGRSEIFETDKDATTKAGYDLYTAAGLPTIDTRFVDFYLNNNGVITRLEEDDYDQELLARYHQRQQALHPGSALEASGDTYKDEGVIQDGNNGEGPYYLGDGSKAVNKLPTWTALDEYVWTYAIGGANEWLGENRFKTLIDGMWTARGDTPAAPNPNLANLRAWVTANFDIDAVLTYLCIRNWAVPFDDTTQNHLLWQRINGKWGMLPWDLDAEFGGDGTTGSIFCGEVNDPTNNFRGPNFFKDSVIKAYRAEYEAKVFLLNNTLLDPATLQANGLGQLSGFAQSRQPNVNSQLQALNPAAFGTFYRPNQPVNVAPAAGAAVLPPATLQGSAYSHTNPSPSPHTSSKWEIRAAAGTYSAPLYVLTSTTNLTSLPIPFDQLTFGGTYFWRVTYFDAQAHPSLTSNETSFVFGQAPVTGTLIAIDAATSWKWNNTLQFNDSSWAQPAYVDTAWPSGPGVLGTLNSNEGNLAALVPPQALRTTISMNGRSAFYFRKHFNFPGSPTSATLSFKTILDDGCVIYLNGQEVYRLGMPAGPIAYATLASRSVGSYQWEGPFTIPATALLPGDNVIAVEVHQTSTGSSDVLLGLELDGTYFATSGAVLVNEICAQNRTVVANGASYPDYLELFNNTAAPVSLTGWGLSDDPLVPGKFSFPAGTTIPAQGYLLVWCDSDATAPGLHAGFKLNHDGQTILLLQNGAVADTVTFGPQARDQPIGRVPNGTGSWFAIQPSPGAANVARTLGSPANLKVNEWLASEVHGSDWFELYNDDANPVALAGLWLSNTPATPKTTQVPALSFIAGKGYAVFAADKSSAGGNHCDFKLSSGGDSVVLTNTDGVTTIDSVTFGAQVADVSQGRLPDGGATVVSFPQSGSQAESNWLPGPVVINEALTHSTAPFEDAIELFNPSASAVNIGNWWLSDDRFAPLKFQIPAGTTVPAGGYYVVYEYQFNSAPGTGTSFALSSTGDQIVLSAVDAGGALTGYRAQVSFGAAADGVSFGRVVVGNPPGSVTPEFWALTAHTFGQDSPGSVAQFRTGVGASNAPPKIGPIIINEVMFHPVDLPGTPPTDNGRDEFIELHNVTTSPVDVSGWRIKNGSDFTFANGTTILPGDYVLVVGFDPATDATSLAAFRATYSLPAGVPLYGPFASKLQNDTQSVELAYPGSAVNGVVPYILVDKAAYSDSAPWPAGADGTGQSLQRQSRAVIGNDPANWIAAAPTPGNVNTGEAPILDSDGDGIPDAWEIANGFNPKNAADALQDADGDGQSNLAEYLAGTDPHNAASFFSATVTKIAGGFQVHFTAQANRGYSVMGRDSLAAGAWAKIADVPAQATAHAVNLTDTTNALQRFYRVDTPIEP